MSDFRYHYPFTKAHLTILIDSLNDLIAAAKRGEIQEPSDGICLNWSFRFESMIRDHTPFVTAMDLVKEFSIGWPQTNSPWAKSYTPVPLNKDHRDRWTGPQLELRLSLMRYMAKRLRDWRRRAPN
jgi:hypothetical protein